MHRIDRAEELLVDKVSNDLLDNEDDTNIWCIEYIVEDDSNSGAEVVKKINEYYYLFPLLLNNYKTSHKE